MAEFHEVPVVEVHSENIKEIWPSLLLAIKASTFIAIDTELSGLGDRRQLFARSIDDRYKAISDIAKTRAVIALGISCFRLQSQTDDSGRKRNDERNRRMNFVVQTFNIFVLCADNYVVEPLSLRFLIEHGFDFNQQYSKGLPYTGGNDKPRAKGDDSSTQHLRQLFVEIALSKVPIVLHNALVDLVFLYQSFYATLPATLPSFLTDLSEIFSSGIYDTKYIVEFKVRLQASFLEYAFRKCQRGNCQQASNNMPYLDISFLNYHDVMKRHVALLPCGLKDQPCKRDIGKTMLCQHFAGHGWCAAGFKCPNSHDVDMILDAEDWNLARRNKKRAKKSKKAKETEQQKSKESDDSDAMISENEQNCVEMRPLVGDNVIESQVADSVQSVELQRKTMDSLGDSSGHQKPSSANRSGGHRAGFDAFMTGYIFASYVAKFSEIFRQFSEDSVSSNCLHDFGVAEEFSNRVYLGGKDFPLQVAPSSFSKPSKFHAEKWERLHH